MFSTVGYIGKPIIFQSNMMALVAKDTTFTSAPHLPALSPTPHTLWFKSFGKNILQIPILIKPLPAVLPKSYNLM